MASCIIFGALSTARAVEIKKGDFVIACDNGFSVAKEMGITPDLVIGDFDSLGFVPEGENVVVLPVKKDDTDVGYAINCAIKKGFSDISVYGALGGMLDHTVANLSLCADATRRGVNITFYGEDVVMTAVTNGSITLDKTADRFSVFALCECEGVTIAGAEFPLSNAKLSPFYPLGVSNRSLGAASVGVKKGTLIIIYYC